VKGNGIIGEEGRSDETRFSSSKPFLLMLTKSLFYARIFPGPNILTVGYVKNPAQVERLKRGGGGEGKGCNEKGDD
jgi:hypothetical protein